MTLVATGDDNEWLGYYRVSGYANVHTHANFKDHGRSPHSRDIFSPKKFQ
jgi:hypothetical protein